MLFVVNDIAAAVIVVGLLTGRRVPHFEGKHGSLCVSAPRQLGTTRRGSIVYTELHLCSSEADKNDTCRGISQARIKMARS